MKAPEIRIETLFATPLALIEHPYCEALNSSLEELFLSRETSAYQNPRPSHLPQPETFESRFDLFHWPEPAVRQLREFMLGSVLDVVRELNHYTPEEVAALTLKNDTAIPWPPGLRCIAYVAVRRSLSVRTVDYCAF